MLRSQKVARRRVQCVMLVAMCGYDPLRLRPSLNLSVFLSLRMAEVSQEERLQAIAVSSFSTHTHTHTYMQSAHQGTLMAAETTNHCCFSGSDRLS